MFRSHWPTHATDTLLAIVRDSPGGSYADYRNALSARGAGQQSEQSIRSRLARLNLGNQDQRVAYAHESSTPQSPFPAMECVTEVKDVNDSPAMVTFKPHTHATEERVTLTLGASSVTRGSEYFRKMEGVADDWTTDNKPSGFYSVDFSNESKPITIHFMSDLHVGARATNYKRLRADVANIAATEGAYVILAGDIIHNHKRQRKSGTALYESLAGPDEQWPWVTDILFPILNRVIGVELGNHEMFDYEEAGLHLLPQWCDTHHLSYWGHGGTVKIAVGSQMYYGGVRHQYPGASSINTSNNQRRLYDLMTRPLEAAHLDFIYLGHLHYNDLQQASRAAGECHYLRGGSYCEYSEYADEKYGAWKTSPGVPSIVLYPDTHDILSYRGNRLELALETLTHERAKYARTT